MTLLAPMPQKLTLEEGTFTLEGNCLISMNHRDLFFEGRYAKEALAKVGVAGAIALTKHGDAGIKLTMGMDSMLTQSYTLTINETGISINGSDAAGVFYGVCTLNQLLLQHGTTLPCLSIIDFPDIQKRGVMLDISRDRVPTLETLLTLVDKLASWKINEVQLYMEHTFAYQAHPTVWQKASPITSEELLTLHDYCHDRHIDLVPNLNTIGHMERWLKHAEYNALAEMPAGFPSHWHEDGRILPASTLNPLDEGSLKLIKSLLDELLPHFTSRYLNIGGDEPWELGKGASKEQWEKEPGRVYLEYLKSVYREATQRGRKAQFWADIIVKYPALVEELPKDAIAMIWGYEANEPNEGDVELITSSELQTYMVPGTSTWNSLAGRTTNAMENLKNAARLANKYGSFGYLITDWGDNGHWQPLSASYLGFLYGACVSWSYEHNLVMDLPAALDAFAFFDKAQKMGRIAYDMGDLYTLMPMQVHNGVFLFYMLQTSLRSEWKPEYDTPELHAALTETKTRIDSLLSDLEKANLAEEDALVKAEYRQIAALFNLAIARIEEHLGTGKAITEDDLMPIIEQHRALWLSRHREGGLEDSVARYMRS